jgi:dihydroflavonol-4-reductase
MTSSTAAIATVADRSIAPTEEDWSDPEGADNSYTRSKTYAERAAWEFMRKQGGALELVTVNPGAVLGPVLEKDYGTSPEIVLKLMTGAFPGIPDFDFPIVDVRDVADLHVAALRTREAAGKRSVREREHEHGSIADVLRRTFRARTRFRAGACCTDGPRRVALRPGHARRGLRARIRRE